MTVIRATLEDIPKITDLAEEMHPEGDYADVPFCREMYEDFLRIAIAQDTYAVFLYETGGEITGGLMASVFCYLFSPRLQAADMGFFVKKKYRGSMAAPQLVKAYEQWARDKGALKIRLDVSTADTKAGAFYERMGYSCVGGNYSKNAGVA